MFFRVISLVLKKNRYFCSGFIVFFQKTVIYKS